ncbi:MAG TPA: radical SAM/SPASM domain-containing protein [Victivallales bacterium]|nr:radical SAM/SPASM domain-containing protein [Victivallales bacterium]
MKNENQFRINTKNRTSLENVIPLDTPYVIYIDPSSVCNFRCKFCPSGEDDLIRNTTRWSGILSMEIFKKAINDLAEFDNPIKALKLFKDGEPLLNKNLHKMVKYAKDSGLVNFIEITTNASLLTPNMVDQLIEAGLNRINISLYGMSSKDFLNFTRTGIDFDKFLSNIRYLYEHRQDCKVFIKTTVGISEKSVKEKFLKIFTPICDFINVENISPFWPGYEFQDRYDIKLNTDEGTFGSVLEEKAVCPYLFYALPINSDGSVDQCSCDWRHDFLIGNVKKQSLKEIWNSKKLFDLRMLHLQGRRKEHSLCKNCNEISYESIDNIDNYTKKIAKKLCKQRN